MNIKELQNKIVKEATKEIGYKEGRNNWNKFAVEANAGWVQNAPWCGTFNVAIYKRVGINLLKIISNPFYVPTMYSEGRAKGIWVPNSQIEAGDLVLFEFNNDSLRDHTGIAIGNITTVEGNTSNGLSGSQSDGGGVFKRTRPASQKRGALSLRLMAQKFPQAFNQKVESVKLEIWESSPRIKGMTKAQVKSIQEKLVKAGYSVGSYGVDGSYKAGTTTAVKEFQKKHGLTVDGVAGPSTIAKLDAVIKGSAPKKTPVKKAPTTPVKKPAAKPTTKKIKVDGRFGMETVKEIQRRLGVKADGRAGKDTWAALQKKKGMKIVDGIVSKQSYKAEELGNGIVPGKYWNYTGRGSSGSNLIKAIQKDLGVAQDGILYTNTVKKLQTKLNSDSKYLS